MSTRMRFSCLAFVLSGQRTDTDDFLAKLQATLAIKRTKRDQTNKTERTDDPTSKRPSAYTQRSAGAVPSSLCCTDTPAWYPERLGRLPRAVVSHLTVRYCCKERGSIRSFPSGPSNPLIAPAVATDGKTRVVPRPLRRIGAQRALYVFHRVSPRCADD